MRQKAKCKVQRAGGTKLLTKSMRQRANGMKLYALCFMLFAFLGCATTPTGTVKESIVPKDVTVLTGIDIQDNAVTITANKPFIYTIYKSSDPYKMIVDLSDVTIGTFNNKIVSNMAGITEIVPSQIESPSVMARLEMLFPTPSIVEQEYKDNILTVRIKEEPHKEESEVRGQESGILEEEKEVSLKTEEEISEPAEPEQKPLPKATEISGISFEKSADTVNVLIKGNGSMIPNVLPLNNHIVIDIPDVILNTQLPSAVVSPVRGIRSGKHGGKMRLVLDLKEKTNFDVAAIGDSIVIALQRAEKETPAAAPIAQMPEDQISTEAEKTETETNVIEVKEPEVLAAGKYTGKKVISIDVQDAPIEDVLSRLFAPLSGKNIVVHPDVKGKINIKLDKVPWDQALDIILRTHSLQKIEEENVIRIVSHAAFIKESEEAAKAVEAGMKAEPMVTKIFPISYAKVSVVQTAVTNSKILTSRGTISVDERTSTMLVNDIASVFPKIENFLLTLDKPTPQVLIEARIVEVISSDARDLGIQWGAFFKSTNTLSSIGGYSMLSTGTFTGENYIVDFPGGAGAGSGSGFNLGILNPAKTMGLDLQISALEKVGKSKIISNPRIVATDNEKATIMQGTSEPFPKVDPQSGQISTEFKDVAISIEVTPHITPAGSISMSVVVKKEDVLGTVKIASSEVPRTSKIEGNTKVLVENGETLVIGGVYKKTERDSSSGVPGLMNIPVFGWLFKNKSTAEDISELLMFITPRIVQKP